MTSLLTPLRESPAELVASARATVARSQNLRREHAALMGWVDERVARVKA